MFENQRIELEFGKCMPFREEVSVLSFHFSLLSHQPIDKHKNKSESERELRSTGDGHHTSIINGGIQQQRQRPETRMSKGENLIVIMMTTDIA